jgi:hypothetical protein
MRRLGVVLAAALLVSCGGALEPGDEVGGVRLVRGAAEDVSLWDFCDPLLDGPARRSCRVPPVDRLRIGPGWRAGSASALDREWGRLEWETTFDGETIDLAAFGTLPDTALGSGVAVREWNVTAEGLRPGRHRLRAVVRGADRASDVTWVIEIKG